jgi:hypothetical protein
VSDEILSAFGPMPDPDLTAILLTLAVAGGLSVSKVASELRRKRALRSFCNLCGRLRILGERTCDCVTREPR